MKVLVACEFSGVVRNAFLAKGHDAYSCDLMPSIESQGRHFMGDVRPLLKDKWDLVIAHPPCTYLANSGVGRLYEDDERWDRMLEACELFLMCLDANAPKVCVENPIMHGHAKQYIGQYSQIIHPWQFGHRDSKTTCLWLKGLPKLKPTSVISKPGKERWHNQTKGGKAYRKYLRSITYSGIAKAMADQWG